MSDCETISLMGGTIIEKSERKVERQPSAHLIHRASIRESAPICDVETEIVAHLPDQAHEP